MNIKHILAFAAALTLIVPAIHAQSMNELVRIEVRVESTQDRKDIKGTHADTVTQHKTLQIEISGKPKIPETRTGQWTIYGRNLVGKSITTIDSGDFKIDLASDPQKIGPKQVSTTSTPEHFVVSGKGARSKAKKVEAEGTKYIGYSVIVKDGDKIVGGISDPMGIVKEASK